VARTRKTLLIVEDSDFSRDLLAQIFEDAYEIELASDGPAALEIVAAKRPDLILMDIGLPGMSGLDVVRAIRVRATTVPIIAVSACVMPGDKERAIEAGCDDFVTKPIDDAILVETATRHLGRQ
jgi:two-component system, cell cycle response regulator DivK